MNIERLLIEGKEGREDSKIELLKRCKPLILSSIKKYHNVGDYDDLIQEGNIVLLESIDNFDFSYKVHFLGYLKLQLKYYYLGKKMDREVSLNEEDENGIEGVDRLEFDFDIEDYVLECENKDLLLDKINRLSKRQKEIILEYYFNELTIGEIANRLDLKYQTVANIKTEGINKLKNIVKKP